MALTRPGTGTHPREAQRPVLGLALQLVVQVGGGLPHEVHRGQRARRVVHVRPPRRRLPARSGMGVGICSKLPCGPPGSPLLLLLLQPTRGYCRRRHCPGLKMMRVCICLDGGFLHIVLWVHHVVCCSHVKLLERGREVAMRCTIHLQEVQPCTHAQAYPPGVRP